MYSQQMLRVHHDESLRYAETRRRIRQAVGGRSFRGWAWASVRRPSGAVPLRRVRQPTHGTP
ncbi:MAG TPA: hypothetical protein VFH80_08015 [Solirubrobacteraceae bacterium]|nr:hypothetical protein [Solirubrobacteraceae bacterium]